MIHTHNLFGSNCVICAVLRRHTTCAVQNHELWAQNVVPFSRDTIATIRRQTDCCKSLPHTQTQPKYDTAQQSSANRYYVVTFTTLGIQVHKTTSKPDFHKWLLQLGDRKDL